MTEASSEDPQTPTPAPKKKGGVLKWILIVLAGLVVIVAGAVFVHKLQLDHEAAVQAEADKRSAEEAERRAEEERRRIEAAWTARQSLAESLSRSVTLNDENIDCDLPADRRAPIRPVASSDANRLMAVSEQPLVVFMVPGFNLDLSSGWQSFSVIRSTFADEISAAQQASPASAICLVRWNTQGGFGEDVPYLANAIDAVRTLSQDPLLPAGTSPRIVVVGYSAGGNFAAYAVTHLSSQPAAPGAPSTDLRLVTVGAPHNGTDKTDLGTGVIDGIAIGRWLSAQMNDDEAERNEANAYGDRIAKYQNQRGIQQLRPGNGEVAALNASLQRLGPNIHYLNVYSTADDVVPVGSATWSYAMSIDIGGSKHTDMMSAPAGSGWRHVLGTVFGTRALSQELINQSFTGAYVAPPQPPPPRVTLPAPMTQWRLS